MRSRDAAIIVVLLIGIGCILFISTPSFRPLGLDFSAPAYAEDAYQVYGVVVNSFEKGIPVIQEETATEMSGWKCLDSLRFWGAAADYRRLNREPQLLKRELALGKPFTLISSATFNKLLEEGWGSFYKRFPLSRGT